jgi:hypothetical protein
MIAPFEFFIFGVALLGIAIFRRHPLPIAAGGLVVTALYRMIAALAARWRAPVNC